MPLNATFPQLFEMRCLQTGNEDGDCKENVKEHMQRFYAVMELTNNDPCTTGCPHFNDGKCEAYRKYHTSSSFSVGPEKDGSARKENATKAPGTEKYPGKSVKQIAGILGVSKNEVRRRKLRNEL